MKGKFWAVMIAAVIGFGSVESVQAQRRDVTVQGPRGSVQVSNTGYGNDGRQHHYRHRHHGDGPREKFHARHHHKHRHHHPHHRHVARHRSHRGYK